MHAGRAVLRIVALVAALFAANAAAADRAAFEAALESIQKRDLLKHVEVLASDAFEGREAGSRGGRAAGGYLVEQFEKADLKPAGAGGGYFQAFAGRYRNILGLLEGSDPELRDEVILVGAHYDHVGYGTSRNSYGPVGFIHNGADDNASGTSGLLELVEAFKNLPVAPRRSVLFVLWDAEEKGLLGSKHWVEHPTVPLERIKLIFNTDMIGRLRGDKIDVYGTRTSWGLRRRLAQLNRDNGLLLDFLWKIEENSDHHPFFERGIPFLMLHTGLHENYHRPSDDVERLNPDGMQRVSRLMFELVWDMANGPAVRGFRRQARLETEDARKAFHRSLGPLPSRLGIAFRERQDGVEIMSVSSGSAADRAGLRTGDVILSFNGEEINDSDRFRELVFTARNPVRVSVDRPGAMAPLDLPIELEGSPIRLGISWREDPAAPGVVVLARVVPNSPADKAGLEVGDRIDVVAGREFADSKEFHELVTTVPGTLELSVERRGRWQTKLLEPLPRAELASEPATTAVGEGDD